MTQFIGVYMLVATLIYHDLYDMTSLSVYHMELESSMMTAIVFSVNFSVSKRCRKGIYSKSYSRLIWIISLQKSHENCEENNNEEHDREKPLEIYVLNDICFGVIHFMTTFRC